MIKEWATVVSGITAWRRCTATLKPPAAAAPSRAGCGSRVLNKLGPQTSHTISVPCEQPLAAGQKVELGIAESSLLGSAMLVYMAPLAEAVCNGVYFQVLFASDIASLCGALLGGVGGFRWRAVCRRDWRHVSPAAGDFERRTAAGSAAC